MLLQMGNHWDQVHMDVSMREKRLEHAYKHFHRLIRDITVTEEQMIHDVAAQINKCRIDLTELKRTFNQDVFDESSYHPGSIALVSILTSYKFCMTVIKTKTHE